MGEEEKILILDPCEEDSAAAMAALQRFFPESSVSELKASSIEDIEKKASGTDVLILDVELVEKLNLVELIYRLRMLDEEPSLVVLARDPQSEDVNNLYKHGCQRCIEKSEHWIEELGTAVDYVLRWRKARAENLRLRAKLTEANMLLEKKNRRLDEFSASIAHDIRGPLGGISMRLDYLLDQYGGKDDERFTQLLSRALDATDRLTDLVQAMYEYAKLGPKAAQMEEIHLGELIQEVLEDTPFEESLDVRVELDEFPIVYGNPGLLRRVFVNLINNAVKYNDKETVELRFIFDGVDERVLAPFCKFRVEDNGMGIDERDLKDIFSMFMRGSKADEQASGIGVGLAVVKRIIDLHYGEIKVSSELGKGTTFFIQLPMQSVSLLEE